ncbi:MAG: 2,3-bisphosphoglycerate-independent phosphoglycerate mutase, partial [Stellaceae bacterium]
MPNRPRHVVLCILDGWGERAERADNAIRLARTPNWQSFLARFPHARVEASELYVGLPKGQIGNSEVGHMNLGAGRV